MAIKMMIQVMQRYSTRRALLQVGSTFLAAMFMVSQALGQAALLPPAKQQFLDNNGNPLAAGKVFHYIPNTSTLKNTWTNSTESSLNTNPVILDAGGRALIYGAGSYRQVLQDSTGGTTYYDALTAASGVSTTDLVTYIANATSGGSANTQTIAATTPLGFALTNGYALTFTPGFTNTGAMTLNVASTGIRNITKPSFSGPVALTGGEVRANQIVQVVYDGAQYVLNTNLPYFGVSTNIASATTTDLTTIASHNAQITGTTGISFFGSNASVNVPFYFIRFSGILTLTNNALLILPGAANITTAANDTAIAQYLGSSIWQIIQYQRAATPPLINTAPTVQRCGSGLTCDNASHTYTQATGALRIKVRMVAGGAGGAARTTNNGADGNNSVFGTWTVVKGTGGGLAGGGAVGGTGGIGGTGGTDGTGTLVLRVPGGTGGGGAGSGTAGVAPIGGFGGASFMGGGPVQSAAAGATGANAPTATGNGGQGGSVNGANSSAGGGAGEYAEFWVTCPCGTTYTVGAGGAGGAAGTTAGGNGGSGNMTIEEFYN